MFNKYWLEGANVCTFCDEYDDDCDECIGKKYCNNCFDENNLYKYSDYYIVRRTYETKTVRLAAADRIVDFLFELMETS
jgi:hypothetical protein